MAVKAYISNISPLWPVERQEATLSAAVPGYPDKVAVFRDELLPSDRQGRREAALSARAKMLRPTTRKSDEVIVVAALPVLDWTAEGMLEALTLAMARNATVRVLDAGIEIGRSSKAAELHQAVKAFASARKRTQEIRRGTMGGRISADRRSAKAKASTDAIRPEWAFPVDHPNYEPTEVLLKRAGVSLNTAELYLGKRSFAQAAYQSSLKRKAKRVTTERTALDRKMPIWHEIRASDGSVRGRYSVGKEFLIVEGKEGSAKKVPRITGDNEYRALVILRKTEALENEKNDVRESCVDGPLDANDVLGPVDK